MLSFFAVAFTEASVFDWEATVVVEGCVPQHGSVGHHAAGYVFGFDFVTGRAAAGFGGGGIHGSARGAG